MKNKILLFLFGLVIICTVMLTGFNSPPKQYVVIRYVQSHSTATYWDNIKKISVSCNSLDEAMNLLSYNGYNFEQSVQLFEGTILVTMAK